MAAKTSRRPSARRKPAKPAKHARTAKTVKVARFAKAANVAKSAKPARLAVHSRSLKRAGAQSAVDRLRAICLALPEAHEVEAWGEPTFRVKGKIFAVHATATTHHGAGRESVWIAAHHATQDLVIRSKPTRYFSPPYVGPSGWIGAWIDKRPAWSEIADFVRDAYRLKAPKKLAAQLGDD